MEIFESFGKLFDQLESFFSTATLSDLFLFSVQALHPSLKDADPNIISMDSFVGRQIATITLKFSTVLCSYSGPERPQFLMRIELTEAIHVSTIVPNSEDWYVRRMNRI